MNRALRLCLLAVAALVALAVAAAAPLGVARAAGLAPPHPGTFLTYRHDGQTLYIGAIGTSDRGHVYCIEAGKPADMTYGEERPIPDGDAARRVAWLADRYAGSRDPMIHAGIGVLAHRHFDLDPAQWELHWGSIRAQHPDLEGVAGRLWDEAGAGMPAGARATYAYEEGLRSGAVDVAVVDGSGGLVAGVPYRVTLSGPARFEDGGSWIEGVSGTRPIRHAWRADGAGEVRADVEYDRPALQQLVSNQDYVRFAGAERSRGDGVRFAVRKDFTPSIATRAERRVVDAGRPVVDHVTSGVRGEDSHWPEGLELTASGWYFDGLDAGDLEQGMVTPDAQASADGGAAGEPGAAERFLERLAGMGYEPAAYGEATFDAPGQTRAVRAVTEPGGDRPYEAPRSGGFGTWVWAFETARQSDRARAYVLRDVVSPFLEAPETNANRARVAVSSVVTDHSAAVGAELSDTITVRGFPEDHGAFAGDETYGIGPDEPYAQVSVWWAGDPDDPANDGAYRPDGARPPAQDEHHRLVGTWDYPAVDGTLRVGAGAPDAHGDPVHITAERHGWYVFIWSFKGDDRVMPAASAYDDAWERTRVEEFARPDGPTIVTQVDPAEVAVGEPFHDAARIRGTVPEGAYVEFEAYRAVGEDQAPDARGLLMGPERVAVDHTLRDQTVSSPQTRSPEPGLVHWRATLFSPSGDVLATHELGVEGEVVTVRPEAPEPVTLPRTGVSVGVVALVALAALATAAAMVVSIARRSGR